MLISVITPIDALGSHLENLPRLRELLGNHDDVEWLIAAPAAHLDPVAASLGVELSHLPTLTPDTSPSRADTALSEGPIRVLTTGQSAVEPSQIGVALGAARGRWCWVLNAADTPFPTAVQHLRELLLTHAPRFVLGNSVVSSKYGFDTAHTPPFPPGPLAANALRTAWGHPAGALPFSMPAVVLETAPFRAAGGCRAVDVAPLLAPIMLADAAGNGFATDALLLHYQQHSGRTTALLHKMHLEHIARNEAWKAPDREEQLKNRDSFSPAWHVRMADPAPGAWWPRCAREPASHSPSTPLAASLPTVSIITATYPSKGREHLISELAESIFSQHGIDTRLIEWVLQEDGEEQSCKHRLDAAMLNDPRVRVEYNGAKIGAAATRNVALTRARGRIILVADDDDVLLPHAVSTLLEGFSHEGVGWVGAGVESWEGHPFVAQNLAGVVEPHGISLAWGHPTNVFPMVHTACAYRIEVLRAIGGWAALPQAEDMSMLVAASAHARGYVAPVPVYRYRTHAGQMTAASDFSSAEAASRMAVWRRACDLAQTTPSGPLAKAVLAADLTPAVRTSRFFSK